MQLVPISSLCFKFQLVPLNSNLCRYDAVIGRLKASVTGEKWAPQPVGAFAAPWKIARASDDNTKWLG
jgi:hypothetical protein